jgi:predicted transcriptional regulator
MVIKKGNSYKRKDFYPEDITRLAGRGNQYNLACWFQEKFQIEVDDAEYLMFYLHEFGAWDYDDLCNYKENVIKLVWLMGCDIAENKEFIYSH